ncbi:MAG: helix-turn-helix transcriptional regulator [Candidatus Gastranaerophilales bacterium]|nr:helix-turn-helix transcriptional regulator [Candidatus Gastranaerophilales bacterium]
MQQNNDELKSIGEHIKQLRKAKKLTLSALCYRNGLEPSTISRIEKGIVEAKLFTIIKLAKALEVSVDELLRY